VAWRSGGFLAKNFNRSTRLKPITKLSYEALHPPLRKPVCLPHNFANLVEKNKESMKNKKNGINFATCKDAKKSFPKCCIRFISIA